MSKKSWIEKMKQLQVGKESEVIRNPFSGAEVTLDPLEVAVHDYIKGCEVMQIYDHFDDARYWFMGKNPQAYMILLD